MAKFIDLTGQKFNRLLVISRNYDNNRTRWNCVCDCGNTTVVAADSMKSGQIKSCGCIKVEMLIEKNSTHKMCGIPEHTVWRGMIKRCTIPTNSGYKNYGGRGISICERWMGVDGFPNFLIDMGYRPSKRHTLDRIDVNGNYCKENCRWATWAVQARNKTTSRWFTYNGESKPMADWAEYLNISYTCLRSFLRRNNADFEKAFIYYTSTPST